MTDIKFKPKNIKFVKIPTNINIPVFIVNH